MGEKKGKRKGLGGLSAEKKKLLKQLIMQKAAEEMNAQSKARLEAKNNHLKTVVGTLSIEGLNDSQLQAKCKELYQKMVGLEEEKYDWEVKIRKQEFEINELTIKVNDVKGKFVKPVLKKVSKTESKLAKFEKKAASRQSFRDQLKSTGKDKYALEEKEEEEKPNFRESLKHKEETPKEDAPPAAEAEEEPQEGQDNEAAGDIEVEEEEEEE